MINILKSGKKHNIPAGFHSVSPDPKEAIKSLKQGYKFLSFSLDSIILQNAAITAVEKIKKSIS